MSCTIAFNGQRLAGQRLGVGRYIEYLLRHWARLLEEDEAISLFVRRPLADDLGTLHPRLRGVLLDSRLSGIPWENLRLRGPARRHDVLFCPAYTGPIGYRGRSVVATHSVNEAVPGLESRTYEHTYSRIYRHCARRADRVIVPSQATLEDVAAHYGVERDRIVVIPQGADEVFHPIEDELALRAVRQRYFGRDRPYLLFVGKCSPRRNIPMLLRAFAVLKETLEIPHGLLLFGPNHKNLPLEQLSNDLGIADDVVQTDGVVDHHADLVPVYCGADLFVHPSETEGWSITTVEAMACGVPVVAANRGGLGEVARGHALMVDDPTVEALVDAIGKVLTDDVLRAELRQSSRRRGQELNWANIARQTLEVVREVGRR